mmetsp:Transcript_107087/g.310919  ORF Transcript_107087/g.310919 Transcript_107087/m.310919 type:complete len:210 (+) Transcript_107087:2179-2808(+)
MLNMAEPTMVPMPKPSLSPAKVSATEVKSSGALEPAARNVAPATSGESCSFSEIISRAGTKNSSHTSPRPENRKIVAMIRPNAIPPPQSDTPSVQWVENHKGISSSVSFELPNRRDPSNEPSSNSLFCSVATKLRAGSSTWPTLAAMRPSHIVATPVVTAKPTALEWKRCSCVSIRLLPILLLSPTPKAMLFSTSWPLRPISEPCREDR